MRLLAAPLAAGCSFAPERQDLDASPLDARPARCSSWAPAPEYFDPCALREEPGRGLALNEAGLYLFDTDASILTHPSLDPSLLATDEIPQESGPAIGLFVESFVVGPEARLRVVGSRPLVVAALGFIEISGELDVSSDATSTGA